MSTIYFLERRVQGNAFVTAGDSNNTSTRPSTFQQIAGLGITGLSAAGGAKALNILRCFYERIEQTVRQMGGPAQPMRKM